MMSFSTETNYTLGLLEGGFGPEPRSTPKPVYYALKLFNEKVGDADSVSDLNPRPEGFDPTNWTWMAKFRKNDQDILVLWAEGKQQTLDLSEYFSGSTVKVSHIVTRLDDTFRPIYPEDVIVSTNAVPINRTPLFVEIPPTVTDRICVCEFVPEDYVIPRLNSSTFEAILTNNTALPQSLFFATKVAIPRPGSFTFYPKTGYLRGPYGITLDPHASQSGSLGLSVPYSAFPGIYKYVGYIGTPQAGLYDTCYFDFLVPVTGTGTELDWPKADLR